MNFEPVVSFVNSTYLSPYHRWFRNPFCQLEMSDDYSLPQFFQWGFNTKWYLLQFRKILMFFLFCFRHQWYACEVCLKHLKMLVMSLEGMLLSEKKFCTNTIPQLQVRRLVFLQISVMERSRGGTRKNGGFGVWIPWERVTVGRTFRLF